MIDAREVHRGDMPHKFADAIVVVKLDQGGVNVAHEPLAQLVAHGVHLVRRRQSGDDVPEVWQRGSDGVEVAAGKKVRDVVIQPLGLLLLLKTSET